MRLTTIRVFLLSLLAVGAYADAAEDLAAYIKTAYTKYEYKVPMRDGAKLFTAVYVPKDDSRDYGVMFVRTPYSLAPYGVDRFPARLGPSEKFAREGFIFVYQDVRGRFLSEGAFEEARPHNPDKKGPSDIDESTDTYDTIDWVIENVPNHNGRVGMWGISYPGFYVAAGMIDAHPALKAASPQAPVTDFYRGDDCYHNGAFFLAANFGFYTAFVEHKEPALPRETVAFDFKTPDAYEFYLNMGPLSNANDLYFHGENPYWNNLVEHTTYDAFWKARSIDNYLYHAPPAVMTVGGWFDAEDLAGPFKVYLSVGEKNPRVSNHLVMGPWVHGGWSRGDGDALGSVKFNAKTSEFYRDEIEFPFFDFYLNREGKRKIPEVWAFQTGTNQWRQYEAWPPKEARKRCLYLGDAGSLSWEAPTSEGIDEYTSDPANPVPFTTYVAKGVPREYMVGDQRFASKRPDVLVYQTSVLEEDVAIAGPISPTLFASTSGTDCDFVVKLIDVYPLDFPGPDPNPTEVQMGGYQQLVRGEPIRAKFRNRLDTPEPMTPGTITPIAYEMPGIAHVFRRGHRIMVQIQSSWFPLIDRNPQTFIDIPNANEDDFRIATQKIHRSPDAATRIELYVVEGAL